MASIPGRFLSEFHNHHNLSDMPDYVYPKISIVMPSFNQAAFIERSILSVINQNYPELEFIVIDGGSTDGTIEIVRKYEKHISFWMSESDQGQSDALNKGFTHATGDIYGWLNSDDLYMLGVFKLAAMAFSKFPEKRIVFGDWMTVDANDRTISREFAFDFNLNHFKYEGFHLNSQSMFWRSEVHHRFGHFDKRLHRTMDYQLILSFGMKEGDSCFLRVPHILGCFRRYEGQKTNGMSEAVRKEHKLMADSYGYEDKYRLSGKLKRLIYRTRRAYWYLKRGGFFFCLQKLRTCIKN